MKVADLTGQRFGMLTVIERVENYEHETLYPWCKSNKTSFSRWKCRCDCGEVRLVLGTNLRAGRTRSCGKHGRRYFHENQT